MGNGHNNDDDDDRKDLTRIEDLSEFLHEEDPDLESKFGDFNSSYQKADGTSTEVAGGIDLNELDETPPTLPDTPTEVEQLLEEEQREEESSDDLITMPDLPQENADEAFDMNGVSFETPTAIEEESSFSFSEDQLETNFDETSMEETTSSFDETSYDETPFEEVSFEESPASGLEDLPSYEEPHSSPPERFEEVKTFAQNFSYGQIQGGGNPPYSIIIRNLKYDEDKESIIALLSEFGLVNDQNLNETTKALELGNLLVPQISEYSAIVLAHKMRRFDCDVEMGLSDEVHPSRSGEHNPKGLVKKDSLRQNKVESYKKNEEQAPAREIIISTTSQLEGYVIKKYIGIQTSFAIVDEDELERLKFVQEQNREHKQLHEYQVEESDQLSSERAFLDFKSSFDYLFISLAEELKTKAQKEKANALLGLSYQLQPLPFEKTASGKNCYQLTASATMALVSPE